MIIGMILIAVFGFMFYAVNNAAKMKLEKEATQIINTAISQRAIKEYVELCLQDVGENGLMLLGEQGGRIYYYQDGGYMDLDSNGKYHQMPSMYLNSPYDRYNVSYMIVNELPSSEDYKEVPFYPCICGKYTCGTTEVSVQACSSSGYLCGLPRVFELKKDFSVYQQQKSTSKGICTCTLWSYCNLFESPNQISMGDIRIQPLCDPDGPNPAAEGGASCDKFYDSSLQVSNNYFAGMAYGNNSFQKQLTYYINKTLDKCTNITLLFESLGYNITQRGDVSSKVTLGDNDIQISAEYPITVDINGKKVKKLVTFGKRLNVKLKKMYYEIGQRLNDLHEPKFLLTNTTFDFIRIYNISNVRGKDDLYIIEDLTSKVKGQNFKFRFMVENRPPALDLINNPCLNASICVVENETIEINPQGYDPDDVGVMDNYTYGGWKEDYDVEFNYSACQDNIPRCVGNIMNPTSSLYIISNNQPKNWTNSQPYINTRQNASYKTNSKDIGYHIFNVTICDKEDLCDYQNVSVLVFDKPFAEVIAQKIYDDIKEDYGSLEDPYILNASLSRCGFVYGGGPAELFNFNDPTEPFDVTSTGDMLYLPSLTSSATQIDILNMSGPFNIINTHRITLRVDCGPTSNTKDINVNVTACLPHRSNDFPYPYNTSNAFQANHTCCVGDPSNPSDSSWGKISSGNVCYSNSTYGGIKSFNSSIYFGTPLPPTEPYSVKLYNSSGIQFGGEGLTTSNIDNFQWQSYWSYANDIYNRTFFRHCDGTRGNICNGTANETRRIIQECSDNNKGTTAVATPTNGVERCSGPPIANLGQNTESINTLSCTDYVGTTFEKLMKDRNLGFDSATGICNNSYSCFGKLSCQKTCGPSSGECNKRYDQSCICKSGNSPGCGADPSCENYVLSSLPAPTGSCNNNRLIFCDTSCGTYLGKCSNIGTNCNAASQCHTKNPGDLLGTCNGDPFEDKCSSNCWLENITSICRGSNFNSDCTADDFCNNQPPTYSQTTDCIQGTNAKIEKSCNGANGICKLNQKSIFYKVCGASQSCDTHTQGYNCRTRGSNYYYCNATGACLYNNLNCLNNDDCPTGTSCGADSKCA